MNNPASQDRNSQPKTTVKSSGHPVVDKLYELEQQAKKDDLPLFGKGQFVPDAWCHVILDERGRPYHLAMRLLAEVIHRHRPKIRNKEHKDGSTMIQLMRNFRGSCYQHNRGELSGRWNVSKDSLSSALTYLDSAALVKVKREDKDINCRGFRNMVFVEPVLEKIMQMTKEGLEKVYKSDSKAEIPMDTESHDAGHVTGIVGATSPASRLNVTGIAPPRGPDHASVSKGTSERSSGSGFSAAKPPSNPEPKQQQQKASASPVAPPTDAVVDASEDCWEALPPKPTGKKGTPANSQERVGKVRYHLGKSYIVWYERKPDLSPREFEELLLDAHQELKWNSSEYVTVIRAGWLWVMDAPEKEPGKTFIPGFYSKKCDQNLRSLFQRSRKENKLFLWHLREELINDAESEYEYDLGNMTWDLAEAWWEEEMLDRSIIRDPSAYYDKSGREISNPMETSWTGINRVLGNWLSFPQSNLEPEQKWLDAVIQRFQREPNGPHDGMHRDDYAAAMETMAGMKLLPADFRSGFTANGHPDTVQNAPGGGPSTRCHVAKPKNRSDR